MTSPMTMSAAEIATRFLKPTVFHYHRNTDIAFSQITGASIKALCGVQGPVGSTPPAGSLTGTGTVCPLCATALADIRNGGTV